MRFDLFRASERLMSMDDAAWARHANPLSVWSRMSCLPLLSLAVYSRAWIGWWSLAAVVAALAWTWGNPRLFAPPERMDSWASRGTLGERLFLDRNTNPVPAHHARAAHVLAALSALGLAPLAWGLAVLDPWAVCAGLAMVILCKLWFVDRMVWLYEEMRGGDAGN